MTQPTHDGLFINLGVLLIVSWISISIEILGASLFDVDDIL